MTAVRSREEISRLVPSAVTEILPALPPDAITGDRHLRDLGADSIDRVEIILLLLDRLGLDEPLASFADLPDIDAMIDLLYRRSNE